LKFYRMQWRASQFFIRASAGGFGWVIAHRGII
jgi:hypothetical protein